MPLRPERPTACAEVGLSPPGQLPIGAFVRFALPAAAESPRHWARHLPRLPRSVNAPSASFAPSAGQTVKETHKKRPQIQ